LATEVFGEQLELFSSTAGQSFVWTCSRPIVHGVATPGMSRVFRTTLPVWGGPFSASADEHVKLVVERYTSSGVLACNSFFLTQNTQFNYTLGPFLYTSFPTPVGPLPHNQSGATKRF
jgi:hypothetical protein